MKDKMLEIRMCNVFGDRQNIAKIMPQIKKSIEVNYSIPLHNDGVGYREYLYVKNVPSAVDLILQKGEGVYNVTLSNGLTVKEMITKAENITGKKVVTHPSHRPGMDHKYQVDGSRMRQLGWTPPEPCAEGLKG